MIDHLRFPFAAISLAPFQKRINASTYMLRRGGGRVLKKTALSLKKSDAGLKKSDMARLAFHLLRR
jgi:hypothetical protein